MRITVVGVDTPLTNEKRAYAEYRFFRSIAAHVARVRTVVVEIRRDSAGIRQFLCTVTLDLGSSGHVRTQARAMHPSAAVDRAADRAAWLVDRRLRSDCSVKARGCAS